MSRFIIFVIGKNFSKVVNEFCIDKKIIHWELIAEKNLNNQQSIIIEYEDIELK